MERCPVRPENLGSLVQLIDDGVISGKIAKSVFDEMFSTSASPGAIIDARGLKQISDPVYLRQLIEKILGNNTDQVDKYREGKTKVFGFFVGQVMQETEGKANPKLTNELLQELLKKPE